MAYKRQLTYSLEEQLNRQYLWLTEQVKYLKKNERKLEQELNSLREKVDKLITVVPSQQNNDPNFSNGTWNLQLTQPVNNVTNSKAENNLQLENDEPTANGFTNMLNFLNGLNLDFEKLSYVLLIIAKMYDQNSIKVFNYEIEVEKLAQLLLSQLNKGELNEMKDLLTE
ncbi:hypothetical protein BC6307_04895 [Sutcliffiella cohnii]|uniref:Uncharacterized protein n=1 Tax=Sutcliffiella cohnii TaxID=33932 RepID=A0A223KMN6_9BACI|nr:hypothetical protein [Sutcliffiella cohnii]AST90666.1 hypothetical protein BC6307_04895 [Sutcliffiella cohnii]